MAHARQGIGAAWQLVMTLMTTALLRWSDHVYLQNFILLLQVGRPISNHSLPVHGVLSWMTSVVIGGALLSLLIGFSCYDTSE